MSTKYQKYMLNFLCNLSIKFYIWLSSINLDKLYYFADILGSLAANAFTFDFHKNTRINLASAFPYKGKEELRVIEKLYYKMICHFAVETASKISFSEDEIRKRVKYTNIELLRIVLMIMIICLHYMNGGMGGALKYTLERSINYYLIRFLESLFIIAVNGFVLITGFCMINKKCVNINKIIRLIIEMTIYNIGRADISIKQIIKECVPLVFNNGYWFFKIYICLYMLIPFINSYLIKLEKDKYKKLLLIMFLLFSVWDSIIPNKIITDMYLFCNLFLNSFYKRFISIT